jgi:Domain of unknown function (DUF4864)
MGQEHVMRVLILLAALLIGLGAPARAADDVAAAYSHAAPAIQGIFPDAETFMAIVRNSYAPVYRYNWHAGPLTGL